MSTLVGPFGPNPCLKTFTCGHCGGIGHVEPEQAIAQGMILTVTQPPAVCHRCWSLVCAKCHGTGECKPLEATLEEIERRAETQRSIAEALR